MNEIILISPELTQLNDWVRGRIIDIENNPFHGIVITAQTEDGNVFWHESKYFKQIV